MAVNSDLKEVDDCHGMKKLSVSIITLMLLLTSKYHMFSRKVSLKWYLSLNVKRQYNLESHLNFLQDVLSSKPTLNGKI